MSFKLKIENSITSLEFDKSGNYLGVGYQCGQVVVFKRTDNTGDNYKLFAQFESHHPEFDFLTSLEIEEKINQMRWIPFSLPNDSKLILTTNGIFKISFLHQIPILHK